MFNKIKNAIFNKASAFKNRAREIAQDKSGASEIVAVIGIIIAVIVIIVIIFMPQISSWFTDTVMPSFKTKTGDMFNFAG